MAEQGSVLQVYSTHTSCWLQVVGLAETKQRRVVSRSYLARSDWQLDRGWNPEERLANDPRVCRVPSRRGRELRTPVGDHVHRQSMNPEDVLHHELGRFLGRG